MRARTTHWTSGRVSRRRGFLVPQPPEGMEESTGTLRGCSLRGVVVPGVAGGVKAGDRSEGSSRAASLEARELNVAGGTPRGCGEAGATAGDRENGSRTALVSRTGCDRGE